MKNFSLLQYIEFYKPNKIKLNLGCGGIKWQDFINVDLYPYDKSIKDHSRNGCVANAFADMRSLSLQQNSVDEIFTSHTIDHFYRWEAIEMLKDWYSILKPNAYLTIEAADFNRCVLWLFHPNRKKRELAKNQFYGNQLDRIEYETHRYLWTPKELTKVLKDIGYRKICYSHKTLTHYPGRDMRVTAIK